MLHDPTLLRIFLYWNLIIIIISYHLSSFLQTLCSHIKNYRHYSSFSNVTLSILDRGDGELISAVAVEVGLIISFIIYKREHSTAQHSSEQYNMTEQHKKHSTTHSKRQLSWEHLPACRLRSGKMGRRRDREEEP